MEITLLDFLSYTMRKHHPIPLTMYPTDIFMNNFITFNPLAKLSYKTAFKKLLKILYLVLTPAGYIKRTHLPREGRDIKRFITLVPKVL